MLERLIEILVEESGGEAPQVFSKLDKDEQFRALCNIRPPIPVSEEFILLQNSYLQQKTEERIIVDADSLEYSGGIALWQGDITRLSSDAIVNACNSALLGCFQPLHNCIDNIIHSYAGVQVRLDCHNLMKGAQLPNGALRVTSAYNLPCRHIFHTVGPIVRDHLPTEQNKADLKMCYLNCLNKGKQNKIQTIAFCCLSTGVYGYPKQKAARIAVSTVKGWLEKNPGLKIIFNVFTDDDKFYYEQELFR